MESLHKNIQLMLQFPILAPTLFLLYINGLPVNVICNITIYADDTTLYSKCDQAHQWQQLELASELKSDLHDTVQRNKKWLGETQLVLFDWSNNSGSIDVKIFKEKNHFLRCWV